MRDLPIRVLRLGGAHADEIHGYMENRVALSAAGTDCSREQIVALAESMLEANDAALYA